MAVVQGANLLVALAVDDDRAPAVGDLPRVWLADGEELHPPRFSPMRSPARLISAGDLAAGSLVERERFLLFFSPQSG